MIITVRKLGATDIKYKIICAGSKFHIGFNQPVVVEYKGKSYQAKMHSTSKGRIDGLGKMFSDFSFSEGQELTLSYDSLSNSIKICSYNFDSDYYWDEDGSSAKDYYMDFLKKESEGNYIDAWVSLVKAMYDDRYKSYKYVLEQMYTSEWYEQRRWYIDMNDKEWRLAIVCIFDDAEKRNLGIMCYLVWQILNHNYRWYLVCSFLCL